MFVWLFVLGAGRGFGCVLRGVGVCMHIYIIYIAAAAAVAAAGCVAVIKAAAVAVAVDIAVARVVTAASSSHNIWGGNSEIRNSSHSSGCNQKLKALAAVASAVAVV